MLLTVSTDLKEFISSYTKNKENFDLQERHDNDNTESNTNKNFFFDNYIVDIFMFFSAVISLLTATLTMYLLCKHNVMGLPLLSERVACALGLWWWTKDSMLSIVLYYCDNIYSGSK